MGLQSLSAFSIQESHNEDSMFFIYRLQTIADITLVRLDSDLGGFMSYTDIGRHINKLINVS